MYNVTFWKDAGERAVATSAQTTAGLLTADATGLIDLGAYDWAGIGGAALIAGVTSVLKSLAAGRSDGNASVGSVNEAKPKSDKLGQ